MNSFKNSKTMRDFSEALGRKEVSKEIIRICKFVAKDENFRGAVFAAGMIQALAWGTTFDHYWSEKKEIGVWRMVEYAEWFNGKSPNDKLKILIERKEDEKMYSLD